MERERKDEKIERWERKANSVAVKGRIERSESPFSSSARKGDSKRGREGVTEGDPPMGAESDRKTKWKTLRRERQRERPDRRRQKRASFDEEWAIFLFVAS